MHDEIQRGRGETKKKKQAETDGETYSVGVEEKLEREGTKSEGHQPSTNRQRAPQGPPCAEREK